MQSLEDQFLELLKKNEKFRLAVASYLGYEEILRKLREHDEKFNSILEEIKLLRIETRKLWENQNKLWSYVKTGFRSLHEILGASFEDYASAFVEFLLSEIGYPEATVVKKSFVYNNEIVEINIFCEDPLVVGEATTFIKSIEEAKSEVEKILNRKKIVEEKTGKKTFLLILAVSSSTEEVSEYLKKITEENNIKLVFGKEIKEVFY